MQVSIPVYLTSNGNTVALSGSFGFNLNSLANPRLALGPGSQAAGMTLTVNPNVSGAIGFLLDSDRPVAAGTQRILDLTFDVLGADTGSGNTLAVTRLQAVPTPISASDAVRNLLSMDGHGGYIDTATGFAASAEITTGNVTVQVAPPQPYQEPVDTTPKNATPGSVLNKPPVNFLGGSTPVTPITPAIDLTPVATAGNIVTSSIDKIKASPLLGVGVLAGIAYLAFKGKK